MANLRHNTILATQKLVLSLQNYLIPNLIANQDSDLLFFLSIHPEIFDMIDAILQENSNLKLSHYFLEYYELPILVELRKSLAFTKSTRVSVLKFYVPVTCFFN